MIWTRKRVAAFHKYRPKSQSDEDFENDPQYQMEQDLEYEFMD